jgi:hypothetical protein
MKIWQRRLSLTGRSSRQVDVSNRLLFANGVDNVLSEAAFRMPPEIRSGGPVSFVLISLDEVFLALTILGGAVKNLAYTAMFPHNGGIIKE